MRSREFGTSVVIVAVSEVIIIITCRRGRRCCSIWRRCSAWGLSPSDVVVCGDVVVRGDVAKIKKKARLVEYWSG